jgi:hypothetical protein
VQSEATCAGLPVHARAVSAKTGKFLPRFRAIGGLEERGVFYSRIDGVRIEEATRLKSQG